MAPRRSKEHGFVGQKDSESTRSSSAACATAITAPGDTVLVYKDAARVPLSFLAQRLGTRHDDAQATAFAHLSEILDAFFTTREGHCPAFLLVSLRLLEEKTRTTLKGVRLSTTSISFEHPHADVKQFRCWDRLNKLGDHGGILSLESECLALARALEFCGISLVEVKAVLDIVADLLGEEQLTGSSLADRLQLPARTVADFVSSKDRRMLFAKLLYDGLVRCIVSALNDELKCSLASKEQEYATGHGHGGRNSAVYSTKCVHLVQLASEFGNERKVSSSSSSDSIQGASSWESFQSLWMQSALLSRARTSNDHDHQHEHYLPTAVDTLYNASATENVELQLGCDALANFFASCDPERSSVLVDCLYRRDRSEKSFSPFVLLQGGQRLQHRGHAFDVSGSWTASFFPHTLAVQTFSGEMLSTASAAELSEDSLQLLHSIAFSHLRVERNPFADMLTLREDLENILRTSMRVYVVASSKNSPATPSQQRAHVLAAGSTATTRGGSGSCTATGAAASSSRASGDDNRLKFVVSGRTENLKHLAVSTRPTAGFRAPGTGGGATRGAAAPESSSSQSGIACRFRQDEADEGLRDTSDELSASQHFQVRDDDLFTGYVSSTGATQSSYGGRRIMLTGTSSSASSSLTISKKNPTKQFLFYEEAGAGDSVAGGGGATTGSSSAANKGNNASPGAPTTGGPNKVTTPPKSAGATSSAAATAASATTSTTAPAGGFSGFHNLTPEGQEIVAAQIKKIMGGAAEGVVTTGSSATSSSGTKKNADALSVKMDRVLVDEAGQNSRGPSPFMELVGLGPESREESYRELCVNKKADIFDAVAAGDAPAVQRNLQIFWPLFDNAYVEFVQNWLKAKGHVADLEASPLQNLAKLSLDRIHQIVSDCTFGNALQDAQTKVAELKQKAKEVRYRGPTNRPGEAAQSGGKYDDAGLAARARGMSDSMVGVDVPVIYIPKDFDFLPIRERQLILHQQGVLDNEVLKNPRLQTLASTEVSAYYDFRSAEGDEHGDFPWTDVYSADPSQPFNVGAEKVNAGSKGYLASFQGDGPTGSSADGAGGNAATMAEQGGSTPYTAKNGVALHQALSAMSLELRMCQETLAAHTSANDMAGKKSETASYQTHILQELTAERDYWKKECVILWEQVRRLEDDLRAWDQEGANWQHRKQQKPNELDLNAAIRGQQGQLGEQVDLRLDQSKKLMEELRKHIEEAEQSA
ncbi:unnamed protein product [Amoebophrya sp. A120]|nr:unnamed protein product [Amoebophrya sp. A120]|eukprot:GSA120T00015166001.1